MDHLRYTYTHDRSAPAAPLVTRSVWVYETVSTDLGVMYMLNISDDSALQGLQGHPEAVCIGQASGTAAVATDPRLATFKDDPCAEWGILRRLAPVTPEPSKDYLTSYAEREARERLQQRLTPRASPTETAAIEPRETTLVLKAWVSTNPSGPMISRDASYVTALHCDADHPMQRRISMTTSKYPSQHAIL